METSAPAAIDVLITAYNAGATVEASVRSILDQTFRDLRVIVVDDGSTDSTPAVLAGLAATDPRLVIVTTANRGIVDAANTGLACCTADYVARLDADDVSFAERLAKQHAFLVANADHVAVSCNVFHIGADGRRLGHVTTFASDVTGDPFAIPSVEPYLMHPFLLVRRAAMVAVGGYRYMDYCEDVDLYWRLSRFGRLAHLGEVLGEYRMHGGSVSSRSIVNGRIASVNSQLSAVSERRRRAGRPDVAFPRSRFDAYLHANALRPIIDLASEGLDSDEAAYLEIASVAKLLEVSSYRPYRLTAADLATIKTVIRKHYGRLTPAQRRLIVLRLILGRPRLIRRPKELVRLVPWTLLPHALFEAGRFVATRRSKRGERPS